MTIPHWLQEHCSRLVAKDEQLTNLNLTSSVMNSPEALAPLAENVLPLHKSLQKLHLSYNRLENVRAIGQALTTNQSLTELYLNYNKIDASSAHSISQGLYQNKTLKVLQMNYNQIGDEGCCSIATALIKDNQSLLVPGLARNGISQRGATALLHALDTNVTLVQLDLPENDIPAEQAARIQILCRANQAGRQFLGSEESLQMGMWPALLERLKDDPDLLYFFLDAKPDLCHSQKFTSTYM